jgi:hypothetical protein
VYKSTGVEKLLQLPLHQIRKVSMAFRFGNSQFIYEIYSFTQKEASIWGEKYWENGLHNKDLHIMTDDDDNGGGGKVIFFSI